MRQLFIKKKINTNFDIANKLNLDVNSVPIDSYKTTHLFTSEIGLRNFQYKVMHKCITTRAKLFEYRIADNPNCEFCESLNNAVVDNFNHCFIECPATIETWNNFKIINQEFFNVSININPTNILLNKRIWETSRIKSNKINEIKTIVKKILVSANHIRKIITPPEMRSLFENRRDLDHYKYISKNQIDKFNSIWS